MPYAASMTKSQALSQMATLVSAGMPVASALERLERECLSPKARRRLHADQTHIVQRMQESDFITPSEASQLSLALQTGRLEPCLKTLARAAEQRHLRRRRLASRLWLSLAMLAVGLLASLAVSAFRLEVSALQTLAGAFWPNLAVPLTLMGLSRWLMGKDRIWWARGYARWPGASRLSLLRQNWENTWMSELYYQYDAGRDPITAVKALKPLAGNHRFNSGLTRALQKLWAGHSLHQSFAASGLPLSPGLLSHLQTGERSGRLSDLLARWLEAAEADLNRKLELLLEWWPRLLYVLSAVCALQMLRAASGLT